MALILMYELPLCNFTMRYVDNISTVTMCMGKANMEFGKTDHQE
jgi:hypothetical protein